ncbi:glycine-rich domain-containing protein 2 isoform X2 [Lolium rigidum]|uniref:glycine-rich domain-containing protein 2 isoform X2 n=1 Tax=Lolium rigidum TaxID=89674 RepID=UPI001F5DD10E|nr:glycine-rich domain-containing protein 2 isoform X2 [Lolium rigidum]
MPSAAEAPPEPTATASMSSSSPGSRGQAFFSVDLAAAARRLLAFLRSAPAGGAVGPRSVRRYEDLWLPLAAEATGGGGEDPAMLVPPPDVQLIWLCHCFHHSYFSYCISRFGRLIDRPSILDAENEEYAADCCRDLWAARYPLDPFDLDNNEFDGSNLNAIDNDDANSEIVKIVQTYAGLAARFASPFVSEGVYHVAAKRRYMRFLDLIREGVCTTRQDTRLVPSLDILLMWLAHQSFPVSYATDMTAMAIRDNVTKMVVSYGEVVSEEVVERTRVLWEQAYDEPYDLSGSEVDARAVDTAREAFHWDAAASEEDANRLYKGLQPRFLMEVYVFLKGEFDSENISKEFLRLRAQRCCRSLKLDKPMSSLSCKNWQKTWHLYCEFATRGLTIEVRRSTSGCFRNSKILRNISFSWNDMLHEKSLILTGELDARMRVMASITPPIQAPYLLKCVPDRVTDDGGAMISDVILRMRSYRPQEGRWLTRTVLDYGGRECFVIRMRIGRGIWRRGPETPMAVKWEDRSIEVREGSWSYIASATSVGYAPEKVVGTATPTKNQQENKVVWNFSTGDVLTVWLGDDLNFQLQNESPEEEARLLVGRRLSYSINKDSTSYNHNEEEQYITLVRTSADHPDGRATVLLNWKLLAVEFLPQEDAVFVLLLCMAITRTMTEIRREDVAGLLVRRRIREPQVGQRDWGSVKLPSSPSLDPHLQPWYRNAVRVLSSAETVPNGVMPTKYSPTDGKDELYRQALIP